MSHEILNKMTTWDLLQLKQATQLDGHMRTLAEQTMVDRVNLSLHPYVAYPTEFLDKLNKLGGLISGSLALGYVVPKYIQEANDLDVYIPLNKETELIYYLVHKESAYSCSYSSCKSLILIQITP